MINNEDWKLKTGYVLSQIRFKEWLWRWERGTQLRKYIYPRLWRNPFKQHNSNLITGEKHYAVSKQKLQAMNLCTHPLIQCIHTEPLVCDRWWAHREKTTTRRWVLGELNWIPDVSFRGMYTKYLPRYEAGGVYETFVLKDDSFENLLQLKIIWQEVKQSFDGEQITATYQLHKRASLNVKASTWSMIF